MHQMSRAVTALAAPGPRRPVPLVMLSLGDWLAAKEEPLGTRLEPTMQHQLGRAMQRFYRAIMKCGFRITDGTVSI